jgi:hypothetical protein
MLSANPYDYWRMALQASQIMTESQTVIALRLSGLAGLWPMAEAEAQRMVDEKLDAAAQAGHAALRVGMTGGNLTDVAMAAMRPVARRTKANVKRLTAEARKAL